MNAFQNTFRANRQVIPVTLQGRKSAKLNTKWAGPLATLYPSYVTQAGNVSSAANPTVFPQGNNQAVDPRANDLTYYDITAFSQVFGNQTVVGGSNITTAGSTGVPTYFLVVLAGLVIFFIWIK